MISDLDTFNALWLVSRTNQVYAVTAGATVPAAFAGVHRNHHFDTRKRLHPLMHPLNKGNTPSSSGHWIRLLFILWRVAGWSFLSRKKRYQRAKVNISFFLLQVTCQASKRQTESCWVLYID